MLSLLPPSTSAVTDPPMPSNADETISLLGIADPWHRLQLAGERLRALEAQLTALRAIRLSAVDELVNKRRVSLSRVAAHIGLAKTRVGQLAHEAKRLAKGGEHR